MRLNVKYEDIDYLSSASRAFIFQVLLLNPTNYDKLLLGVFRTSKELLSTLLHDNFVFSIQEYSSIHHWRYQKVRIKDHNQFI